jgi:protein-disulfide isomerase
MKQKAMFIAALAALLLAFLIGVAAYKSQQDDQSAQLSEQDRARLVRMYSPALGGKNAPVVIVEFLDPACSTCREFYPLVKQMMAANPDRIRLVLRYAPFHEGSENVVKVLEAARKQGKFWPALEALLGAQPDWVLNHKAHVTRVWKHLEGLGLDFEQMQLDMTAPQIADMIAQDLGDARALNVTKTPEYFVNGRPLPSFGYDQLKRLVDDALAAAPRA